MAAVELRGRVMGSELHIVVTPQADAALLEGAIAFLDRLEARWSRFIPTSDITRINTAGGQTVPVAPETMTLLATMIEAWRISGGRCDSGVLPVLMAAGDNTSRVDPSRRTVISGDARFVPGALLDLVLDHAAGTVVAPAGLALDPGGVGKGLAADLTVRWLVEHGAAGALVGIGGDLAMIGDAPDATGWTIMIERPAPSREVLGSVAVEGGGVATSSTTSRRWDHDGVAHHHIIDPATGRQSDTDLAAVTVIADTGWAAEAHATAALLAGGAGVLDHFEGRGLSGLAITDAGAVIATADVADALTAAAGRS